MVTRDLLEGYKGKKVLVTGHTGFKGSWLSIWLNELGANVVGVALDPKTSRDNFLVSNASEYVNDIRYDINDFNGILGIFKKEKPEIVFHLAAQPLVLESYLNPLETFKTNTLGTANILEAIRLTDSVKVGIMITTDKVYHNHEWVWPYREEDRMGGYDPYSASKGASEIVIDSFRKSFFNPKNYAEHGKSIASVRAGNVIGGGDWSINRIIPDCIKSLENNEIIEVRNPNSIRPWQHVLEPLSGYLMLGAKMLSDPKDYAQAWNFGPEVDSSLSVKKLVNQIISSFGKGNWKDVSNNNECHEAKLLSLDINKAKYYLGWKPILNFEDTVAMTVNWYLNCEKDSNTSLNQIREFQNKMMIEYGS